MDAYLLAAVLITMGVCILLIGWRARAFLPRGRVIYLDTGSLKHPPETIYDPKTDLAGRPDYIIRTRDGIVPVELKSSTIPRQPYEGHILQLAAYCLLIESSTGHRPPYGVIRYHDHSFRINYTHALRRALYDSLKRIRGQQKRAPARSHGQASRCHACGYQSICDQSL